VFQDWLQLFLPLVIAGDDGGFPVELTSWLLPYDVIATDKPEEISRELLKIHGVLYYW